MAPLDDQKGVIAKADKQIAGKQIRTNLTFYQLQQ